MDKKSILAGFSLIGSTVLSVFNAICSTAGFVLLVGYFLLAVVAPPPTGKPALDGNVVLPADTINPEFERSMLAADAWDEIDLRVMRLAVSKTDKDTALVGFAGKWHKLP